MCGLGGVDHNLTYNYSSSEVTQNLTTWSTSFAFQESLNESFSIVIGQKLPRSAESSMRRSAMARPRPEITLQVCFPCLRILSSTPLSQKEKLFHEQKRALVACNASVKHANLQFFLISQYIVSSSSLYRKKLFPSDSKKTCLGRCGKDPTRSCLSLSFDH